MKKRVKKLTIDKETLRGLDGQRARGGTEVSNSECTDCLGSCCSTCTDRCSVNPWGTA
jgi:hypothetical protein